IKCDAKNAPPDAGIINPGPWLYWTFKSLEQWYNCNLMVMLSKISLLMHNSYRLAQWQILYTQSVTASWINWIPSNLIPWLNGHFANIANGRVTTINAGGEQCNNLFCLGQSIIDGIIAFVGRRINTIVNAISSIVNLVASLFARIFEA